MSQNKITKYKNKLQKIEKSSKYSPRKYFTYQRKVGNSLAKSIINTCTYIDKNIDKSKHKDIFKLYEQLDFNNKQFYNLFASIAVALITGVLLNYFNKIDYTETIFSQNGFINQIIISLIIGIIMLIPLFVIVCISFGLILSLRRDYMNDYDIFIAPYERKKAIERIEKEIDNYKYRNLLE